MADIRERDQPGTIPRPRRDGGHSTSIGSTGGQNAGEDALVWSVTAMSEAVRRIGDASGAAVPQAVAAATEAVWWVTVVDAAITRHCPTAYRSTLAALDPAAAVSRPGEFVFVCIGMNRASVSSVSCFKRRVSMTGSVRHGGAGSGRWSR